VNFSVLRRGRGRLAAAAALAVVAGAAALPLAGPIPASAGTVPAAASRAQRSRPAARPARLEGTSRVAAAVLVDCQHHAVIAPRAFTLTCADGNDVLINLSWVSWRGVAYGSGTERVNSCVPSCAARHFLSYPALITLWRAPARGHGTGPLRFSRLTEVYTGARPARFTASGGRDHPATFTWHV
jgi:hypothetical protein